MLPRFVTGEAEADASFVVQIGDIDTNVWYTCMSAPSYAKAQEYVRNQNDPTRDFRILKTYTELVITIPKRKGEG